MGYLGFITKGFEIFFSLAFVLATICLAFVLHPYSFSLEFVTNIIDLGLALMILIFKFSLTWGLLTIPVH